MTDDTNHDGDQPDEADAAWANNPMLAAHGYLTVRANALGSAQAAANIDLELLDQAVDYARTAIARARLQGAPQPALDQMDDELRILHAVRHLSKELKRLGELAQARQAIVRPQG